MGVADVGSPIGGKGSDLRGVDGRPDLQLRHPRLQVAKGIVEYGTSLLTPRCGDDMIGGEDVLLGRQLVSRIAQVEIRAGQADRQAELDGQLQVDVEELRAQAERLEMRAQVGEIEAPEDRALDLSPTFPTHLLHVGVFAQVGGGPGEAPVAVEQRWCIGDRSPPVEIVFGEKRERKANVFPVVPGGRGSRPWARNLQTGGGGDAVPKAVVDGVVGGVRRSEAVAGEDHQPVRRTVTEQIEESAHAFDGSAGPHRFYRSRRRTSGWNWRQNPHHLGHNGLMTRHEGALVERLPEKVVGPRLELRIWDPAWADELSTAVVNSLVELRPFMPWAADEPLTPEERREIMAARRQDWSESGDGFYTVSLDGRVIGSCGLHRRAGPGLLEIGYWIDSDHTGQGFATEAAVLLRDVALAHPGNDGVIIRHDRANPASGRVAAKAGFVFAAERPADEVPGGEGVEWIWRFMPLPGFVVRPERPDDTDDIAAVVEAAFTSPVEAGLVAEIRASPLYVPEFALVAEIDDPAAATGRRIVGHVMISGCTLRADDGAERAIAMLSPLAVAPDVQRCGTGAALVRAALDRASVAGQPLVVVAGDPAFYRRFGFEPATDRGIELPLPEWASPDAGQVIRLPAYDPSLTGSVVYPPAFDGLE